MSGDLLPGGSGHRGGPEGHEGRYEKAWKGELMPDGININIGRKELKAHKQAQRDGADNDRGADGSRASERNRGAERERDVVETVRTTETRSHDQAHHIASGFRYATLSQTQLDGADPKHPVLTPASTSANTLTPPGGLAGTGNPFFRPNPMVTFFEVFTKLKDVMKWLQQVSAKLTVIEMQAVKDTGLSQAAATLAAGKAQAHADRQQAIVSFVQGAVSLGQLGTSIKSDINASRKAGQQFQDERTAAMKTDKMAKEQQKDITEMEAKQMANQRFLSEKLNPAKQPKAEVGAKPLTDDQARQMAKNRHKAAEREYNQKFAEYQTAAAQTTAMKNAKGKNLTQKEIDQNIKTKEEALANATNKRQKALEDHEYHEVKHRHKDSTNDQVKADLEPEMRGIQAKLLEAKTQQRSLQQSATQQWDTAQKYNMRGSNLKAWETRATLKQADPLYLYPQMLGTAINHFLDAAKMLCKAHGDEQAAFWNSTAQIYGTYNTMIKTCLDSTIQMGREAYQQANDLMQTLMKMSDQQTQSMHWSA